MGEQLDIFGAGVIKTESMQQEDRRAKQAAAARPSIDQRFAEFHQANPHVLVEMMRLARERLARGEKRIGVKALWEELRQKLAKRELAYDQDFVDGKFKLNNDFTAIYARKLVELEKSLEGVIEMRKRKDER